MQPRTVFITAILLATPLLATAPAATSFTLQDESMFSENMLVVMSQLRETARTPEELADIEDAIRAIEQDPEAFAAWLLGTDTTPEREISGTESGVEDGDFTILRTDDRTKPVLIIHGRDNYDMANFATLRNYYLGAGFTTVHRVGYYGGECNVEYRAEHHGDHNNWYGGSGEHSTKKGCNGVTGAQVHDLDTDIMHMSYHLAWMIYDHFGVSNIVVDGVAHSMGGLMLRYAIAKSGSGGVWPVKLKVEDAVTIGSPHGGLGTSWCKVSPWADVRQMCSDNSWIVWMKNNAQNPQGTGGTDWTVIGSDCDGWVAWNLAVDMSAAHKAVYVSPCYGHSDYYGDVSTVNDATVDRMNAPATTWTRWTTGFHGGKLTNWAATYGTY